MKYEFQAINKFLEPVRGQIQASSVREAKKLVRQRKLFFPKIWPSGEWPSWCHGTTSGVRYPSLLRLSHKDRNVVVFAKRRILHWILGMLFLSIGMWLILLFIGRDVSNPADLHFFPGGRYLRLFSNSLTLVVGILFSIVGGALVVIRLEIRIDRRRRLITKRMGILPGKWWSDVIDGRIIEKVVYHIQRFYEQDASQNCHVVSLTIGGERTQLHFSNSKKTELELAGSITDYLNVPFESDCPDLGEDS